MADKKTLKISYCTTCKGRLHHLKQTLPANMAAERNNPNVEFVVLDYGSEDGLADWIKQNFQAEMDSGRLRYARYETPYFKMAHAKNMAHRLATGDVLCNVDADNFIAKDFSKWLTSVYEKRLDTIVTTVPRSISNGLISVVKRKALGFGRSLGLTGRIAISKQSFRELGGYDESFTGWGGEDTNLSLRARDRGMGYSGIPTKYWGAVIPHEDQERVKNMDANDKEHSLDTLNASHRRVVSRFNAVKVVKSHPEPIANPDGNVGCGTVHINFSTEPTVIGPISKSMPPAPEAEAGLNPHARVGHVASLAKQHGGVHISR